MPPTGAKGLNLAFSDAYYLSRGLIRHYKQRDDTYLDGYSETALRRVWGTARLSWYLTRLLHLFPDDNPFDQRTREDELDYVARSENAMARLAERYVGLPYE